MKSALGSLRNLILAVFSGLLMAAIMPASVLYDFSFPAFSPVNDIHFSFLENTYITLTGSSTISGATVTDTLGDSWNFTDLAEHNLLDGDILISCFVFGAPPVVIGAASCGGSLLANPGAGLSGTVVVSIGQGAYLAGLVSAPLVIVFTRGSLGYARYQKEAESLDLFPAMEQ